MDNHLAVVEEGLTGAANSLRVSVTDLEPAVVMTKNPEQAWQGEPRNPNDQMA
jgi:hypothetical protein